MYRTLPHRIRLRASEDALARFVAQTPVAQRQVEELLNRGARLLSAQRDRVALARGRTIAEVDALGRVTWRVQPPAAASRPRRRRRAV